MGADIYLKWEGMTEKDKAKQITGFSVVSGKYGYLRGAYNRHIGYDAILILFDNIKWEKDWKVDIKLLKANLEILEKGLFKESKNDFYSEKGKDVEIQSFRDFVKLAEDLINKGRKVFVHFSY